MSQEKQTIESANQAISTLVSERLSKEPTQLDYDIQQKEVEGQREKARSELNRSLFNEERAISTLIDVLERQADLKLGIIRSRIPKGVSFVGANTDNKVDVEIRDARLQKSLPGRAKLPNDVPENWMVNAAATARGAIKLLSLSGHEAASDLKQEVLMHLQNCISAIEKNGTTPTKRNDCIKQMNTQIKKLLCKNNVSINGQNLKDLKDKDLSRMMIYARDSANLATDHYITTTISGDLSQGQRVNHIQSFIPVVPVSDKLTSRYQNLNQQEWYKSLTPIEQALAKSSASKLTDGKHILPTQLQFMPGVRNYGISTTCFSQDNQIDQESSRSFMRSGAPAYNVGKAKDGAEREMHSITAENVEHVQTIAHASGKDVEFHLLTNEVFDEKRIGKALATIVAQIPGKALKLDDSGLGEETSTDESLSSTDKALSNSFAIKASPLSITHKNKHAHLSGIWETLSSNEQEFLLYAACKSGKDRTGLVDKSNNLLSVKEYLESINVADLEHAYKTYNDAMHNEFLAASNGGSRGSNGLKADTSYVLLPNKSILQYVKKATLANKACADLNASKDKDIREHQSTAYTTQISPRNPQSVGYSRV